MNVHRICIGLTVALCLSARAALPQASKEVDERIDRIVGMATTRGGALAFLQKLIDSIGTPCCRRTK